MTSRRASGSPIMITFTGPAAGMRAPSARATSTTSTKAMPTLRMTAITTSTRCRTWPMPGHAHVHGPGCGHEPVTHGDHVDYAHDGHRHAADGDHYDEH